DRELLSAYLEWGSTVENLRDLLLKCARADAQVQRHYDPESALAVLESVRATASPASALGACDELREPAGKIMKWAAGPAAAAPIAALIEAFKQMPLDEAIAAEL